jgi:glucose/arabinose dehydrogenase
MSRAFFSRAALLAALSSVLFACQGIGTVPDGGGGESSLKVSSVTYGGPEGTTSREAVYPVPSMRVLFSGPVNADSVSNKTIHITRPDGSGEIPVSVGIANVGNSADVTALARLDTSATYKLTVAGVKDTSGKTLATFTENFTVRSQGLPAPTFQRAQVSGINSERPATLTFDSSGDLYIGEFGGMIRVVTPNAAGTSATTKYTISTFAGRTVLGLAIREVGGAKEIWVSHSAINTTGEANSALPNYAGTISKLSGAGFSTKTDVITGIPRSAEFHQNNGIAFGPDGKLYVAVGGSTNLGGAAPEFGNRPERFMGAAILVADLTKITGSVNIQPQSEGGSYPITKANMFSGSGFTTTLPVKIYVTGLRNPYDLVWTSGGQLFSTDNGANVGFGATPGAADGCPSQTPQNLDNTDDEINLIQAGVFYGHPNPARGECQYQAGPTYGADSQPFVKTGLNRSTDGIAEYRGPANTLLQGGDLIFVNYSFGDSVFRFRPTTKEIVLVNNPFNNPIDVAVRADGRIFIAEFGSLSSGDDVGGISVVYY